MASNIRRAPSSGDNATQVWQSRTDMVKKEMAAASAAADAKTARLKALRLEKEAQEAELARTTAKAAPAPKKRSTRGT